MMPSTRMSRPVITNITVLSLVGFWRCLRIVYMISEIWLIACIAARRSKTGVGRCLGELLLRRGRGVLVVGWRSPGIEER